MFRGRIKKLIKLLKASKKIKFFITIIIKKIIEQISLSDKKFTIIVARDHASPPMIYQDHQLYFNKQKIPVYTID